MPQDPKQLSLNNLAKYGHFDELRRRCTADADLVSLFSFAVTDYRTVKRNPGHLKILKWCIDQGLDFSARAGWLNQSLICLAAANGNDQIVRHMLQVRPSEDDPFVWASTGDVELLTDYASRHDLSALRDQNDFNLLFCCAGSALGRRDKTTEQRLTNTCRLLLNSGVDPAHEVSCELPISPAFLCAARGGNRDIMQQLLENKGLAADRFHPVMEHALESHQRSGEPFYGIAQSLLQHGFDVNEWNRLQGRSLLHGAANRGTVKAVKWLLENGADPDCRDKCGRTPLHVAAQRNTYNTVVELLITAGAKPAAVDEAGKTPLDYAREKSRIKVVDCLQSFDNE